MERFAISLRQLSILTLLSSVGLTVALALLTFGSDWSVLSVKNAGPGILPLTTMRAADEWPLSDETLARILRGESEGVASFEAQVGPLGLSTVPPHESFHDQFVRQLERRGAVPPKDFLGRFAVWVDVPMSALQGLTNPHVMALTWGNTRFYVDGELRSATGQRKHSVDSGQLFPTESPSVRLTWVVDNFFAHKLGLFGSGVAPSIRSEEALGFTQRSFHLQQQIPSLVACSFFLLAGVFALALAGSSPQFPDIWCFAAFSVFCAAFIWCETPLFYETFNGLPRTSLLIMDSVIAGLVCSAAALTLSFFRIDGRSLRLSDVFNQRDSGRFWWMMGVITLLCAAVVIFEQAVMDSDKLLLYRAAVNNAFAGLLALSQLIAMSVGVRSLVLVSRSLSPHRFAAQRLLFRSRLLLSAMYVSCMAVMVVAFCVSIGSVHIHASKTWPLMSAVLPAMSMLLMFVQMLGSANKFYRRFSPRLNQIDYEVMAFGAAALERRYLGTLLVFDLAGMKALNELRVQGRAYEDAIDSTIATIERDLGSLIQTGEVTFRYKSNGDEFIFAMLAENEADLDRQLAELTSRWVSSGPALLAAWKQALAAGLKGDGEGAAARLELHVLISAMREMKITVRGGLDAAQASPDFLDPGFIRLSRLFKESRSDRLAVFAADAKVMTTRLGLPAAAFVTDAADPTMGYLETSTQAALSKAG